MWVIKTRDYQVEGVITEPVFEVGYYVPAAAITPKWVVLYEFPNRDSAVDMVHYLNGGSK